MFSIKGLHESYRAILLTNNIKTKNGLISSKAFFSYVLYCFYRSMTDLRSLYIERI